MPSLPLLKALGLNFSPNQLEVQPGSLVEASNIIIRRDNVIESRRGYALYGTAMGSTSDRCKQLMTYKNKLIRHFANRLQYENGLNNSGVTSFFDFNEIVSGSPVQATISEAQTGLRIKSVEANSNLYFTTSEGIKKISAKSASTFAAAEITQAGGVKALDTQAFLTSSLGDEASFLPADSGVAYKIVWGTKDANGTLILGTPSDPVTVLNPLIDLTLRDFSNFLLQLDNVTSYSPTSSLLNDTNYYTTLSLPLDSTSVSLKANLIALAKKLDEDLLFANDAGSGAAYNPLNISSASISSGLATINFSAGVPSNYFIAGDKINIPMDATMGVLGFTSNGVSVDSLNTNQTIASVSPTNIQFTIKDYSTSNPIGISGTATNISTVGILGTGDCVVTCASHGLKNNQKITISGSNSVPDIDGTYNVTYLSKDTFSVNLKQSYTTTIGSADITSAGHGYAAGDTVSFSVTTPGSEAVTFQDAGDTVTLASHGLLAGDRVSFSSIVSTTGISTNTTYYVINPTTNTFQLSLTSGGSALPLTTNGSGTLVRIYSDVTYYVISTGLTLNTFRVSTTAGGTQRVLSGSGFVSKVVTNEGSGATWNTVIDGTTTAKIESYVFRSIQEPVDQDIPPTNNQLVSLKEYFSSILVQLQEFISARSNNIVASSVYSLFLEQLVVTSNASVTLKIAVPFPVQQYTADNNPYFYQIYRTAVSTATGVSTINNIAIIQEYTQIEEKFPTASELSSKTVVFLDNTPESIAGTGANLYTNERSGEGGLQANDIPPYALDINSFKGSTFFANTRTRQRKLLTLVGVVNMVNSFNVLNPYKLTISDGVTTNTYSFVTGVQEVSSLTCAAASGLLSSGLANYFLLNSANDETQYYVWYKTGTASDPAISGKTGIVVSVNATDSNTVVAQKTTDAINNNMVDFTASVVGNIVTITNATDGYSTNSSIGTLPVGFSILTTQEGRGESASLKQVLLSSSDSIGIAIEDTVKSLIRVINKNSSEIVNAFYVSGTNTTPGTFLLEGKGLSVDEFYLLTSDSTIGESFNPTLSPGLITITSINTGLPVLITTSSPHNLLNGEKIIISNSNSTPSIDGIYEIDYENTTQFYITPLTPVSVLGTSAVFNSLSNSEGSSNEEQPHRVYYSKFQQPEAVPVLNYIDIGATDKEILRIFPLRDSLFVFKQDGLFRISGESAPFSVALFDSSCVLIAPDSVAVANNQIYGWTTQGISTITEAGVNIISRAIDTEILRKASSQFTNFKTATWGVGYESDNSYTVYTVNEPSDTEATIGFRYSNLTSSWTTVDKSCTAGLVNPADDKLYLGAGDTNFLEKERKEFTRYDYADRELPFEIVDSSLSGAVITLPTISGLAIGDVVVQDQTVTVYEFNTLLEKLDLDPGVPSSDYYSTLKAVAGDDMRSKIESLVLKLDGISGTILTASSGNPVVITTSAPHGLQTGQQVTISGNSQSVVNQRFEVTVVGLTSFTIPINLMVSGVGGSFTTELTPGYGAAIASLSGSVFTTSVANPTVIKTTTSHGLQTGRIVTISGNSQSEVNGTFAVTVIDADEFTVPVDLLISGSGGSFITVDENFQDLKVCYNIIISRLNSDPIVAYSNYRPIDNNTIQEAIISSINIGSKTITLNLSLDYVVGDITIYKSIPCRFTYSPITMGDPLGLKHIREATMMFANKAFTSAKMEFSTDLLPEVITVSFNGDGNGIFGHQPFGSGFFGGASNSAPFRTFIPRQCQRCRYINVGFQHNTAREEYAIYGITLTGEVGQSTRAYR
jgi:hypothetical protein